MYREMRIDPLPYSRTSLLAVLLALAALLVAISSAIGFRLEWWGYGYSLKVLRVAVACGVLGTLFALAGLYITWPGRGRRRGLSLSLLALLFLLPALLVPLYWNYAKSTLPPIQDISTDLQDPPAFWVAPTSQVYPGDKTAAQQRAAFPDIVPARFSMPPGRLIEQVVALVEARGWTLLTVEPDEGRVEATVTTFWYGFKDDVAIRLSAVEGGTRLDMRSTSRFGTGGDGGANARRIRDFIADLKAETDP